MANYKITAEISVTGSRVRSKNDAINTIQEMLDAFGEMTNSGASIIVHPLKFEKLRREP